MPNKNPNLKTYKERDYYGIDSQTDHPKKADLDEIFGKKEHQEDVDKD